MKANYEAEHERNIKDMIQDDDYKSPWKNKDATVATSLPTVNNPLDDTGYTYLNSYDTSDLDKNPKARKEPIKDTKTIKDPIKIPHLVNRVRYLMDGPTNMEPVLTGVGITGQGGPRTISGGKPHPKHCSRGEKYNLQRRHHACPDKL